MAAARWIVGVALRSIRLPKKIQVAANRNCSRGPVFPGLARRCFSSSEAVSKSPPFDILFCGSDAFSTASLKTLVGAKDTWRSLTVLTPHEKSVRIKGTLQRQTCVLGNYAIENGIPVEQVPVEGISAYQLPKAHTDPHTSSLLITASFGHILPNTFLSHFLPAHCLNVHPSLLPRYRGAAPIQWTIANGEKDTGVTVQRLVGRGKGIDSGEILGVRDGIIVPADATYDSLLPKLADIGGELLVEVVRAMQESEIHGRIQDPALITRAPKITEATAQIHFSEQSAETLFRLFRGISHQHPLWSTFEGQKLQFTEIETSAVPSSSSLPSPLIPGLAILDKREKALKVACAPSPEGGVEVSWLAIRQVKPAGRKGMPVIEWWNGLPRAMRAGKYIILGT